MRSRLTAAALVTAGSLCGPAGALAAPLHITAHGPNDRIAVAFGAAPPERTLRAPGRPTRVLYYAVALKHAGASIPARCNAEAQYTPGYQGGDLPSARHHVTAHAFTSDTPWCLGRWTATLTRHVGTCRGDGLGGQECDDTTLGSVAGRASFRVRRGVGRACLPAGETPDAKTAAGMVTFNAQDVEWGCLTRVGLAQPLDGNDGLYTTIDAVRRAGDWVSFQAYEGDPCEKAQQCPPGFQAADYIGAVDLRTGARRRSGQLAGSVQRSVLTRHGTIAWVQGQSAPATAAASVHVVTAAGERVLDSGTIPAASLQLTGNVLHWTNAGAPRSAPLP